MRVKLRFKSIEELPVELFGGLTDVDTLRKFGANAAFFELSREIVVLGLEFWRGNVYYRLANPPDETYAILVLALFFEIVVDKPSRYWRCKMGGDGRFLICHPDWHSPWYFDRLSDADADAIKVFGEVMKQLKEES